MRWEPPQKQVQDDDINSSIEYTNQGKTDYLASSLLVRKSGGRHIYLLRHYFGCIPHACLPIHSLGGMDLFGMGINLSLEKFIYSVLQYFYDVKAFS